MRKIFSLLLFLSLLSSIFIVSPAFTAVKKKTVRPTFPAGKEAPARKAPAKPAAAQPKPAPAAEEVVKSGWLVEGGLGGGAALVELGYQKGFTGKLSYQGGVGYAVGNKYGVVVVDVARINYDLGAVLIGAGLNYAMYSEIVSSVPGISGSISNKNLFGGEVFLGKRFGRATGKVGYSTSLGARASLAYGFFN